MTRPGDRSPASGSSVHAYHGLARAVAKVTLKATGSMASRALETMVNVDAWKEGSVSSKIDAGGAAVARYFTVLAQAKGLPPASLKVVLSTDPEDSVLAVAKASAGLADVGGGAA